MRKFRMRIEAYVEIELADEVIDVVDDEWRSQLYDLNGAEEIAAHIGRNMAVNDAELSLLDGWADQPNSNARMTLEPDWEVTYIKELK
jgi:hypothetical protein